MIRAASLARHLLAALVIGVMAVGLNVSSAAVIYQGPLAPFLDRGIALTQIGSVVMGVASALLFSYRGAICQPQNTMAVIMALSAAAIAAGMPEPQSERGFATVAAFVALTTATVGAAAWLLGRLRLGLVARFIPFPVMTGFLAATGYLLIAGGLGLAIGEPVRVTGLGVLLEPGHPIRWIPWALAAVAIATAIRALRQPMAFPVGLLLATLGFYAAVGLGPGLDGARAAGWLLGPFEGLGFLPSLRGWQPLAADGRALVAQTPHLLAILGLAVVSAVLSASSLEVATGTQADPDRDLRGVGIANLAAAAAGGSPVGYHSLSLSTLAYGLGATGPSNGWVVTAACALALAFGGPVLSAMPIGVFAAGIMVIGLNLLVGPLIDQRRSLPITDYAVVLLIPAVAAGFGFLWGVAVGLAAATLFFVVTFARIDVVRLATTGARLRSRLERPDQEQARLATLGRQISIYRLEGYIFFGTAHRLARQLEAALERNPRPRFVLIDFRRVRGLDTSAARALLRLDAACRRSGVELILTGLGEPGARLLRGLAGAAEPAIVDRLDAALEAVEDRLLAADPAAPADMPDLVEALGRRHPDVDLDRYFRSVSGPAGAEVVEQGAVSDSLLVLRSGALRTEVTVENDAPVTVARCRPGALVGEIGLYAGVPRTARVVAERPSEFRRLDAAALERMAEEHPAVLADLNRMVAATLARRLGRTTALLADAMAS